MEIDARQKEILRELVDLYVETAEPVGSKSLAERQTLGVSPATLRGEMAELEAMGYLEQPHTSAGRIPTPLGYRLYVDELMRRHRLSVIELEDLTRAMKRKLSELDRFAAEAGRALAQFTRYPTLSLTAADTVLRVQKFELLPLSGGQYVCIIIGDDGQVHHETLRLPDGVDGNSLHTVSASLNTLAAGIDLTAGIPADILQTIESAARFTGACLADIDAFIRDIVRDTLSARGLHVSGGAHLLSQPEYHNAPKAQRLLEYLGEERATAVEAMKRGAAKPVQIIIGPENAAEALSDASVILASYSLRNNLRGIIGLVGPTRMDYASLASKLEHFAARLERLFLEDEDSM
jgi:heat-inducible transcriptional repressor